MGGRVVLFSGWLSPKLCRAHPDCVFVFGDNLLRIGMGGQAIIREQPNAVGVATKRKPAMSPRSFFDEKSDDDLDAVLKDIGNLWRLLKEGNTIVIPVTEDGDVSLGLERARLKDKAPSIYRAITTHVQEMVDAYGNPTIVAEL